MNHAVYSTYPGVLRLLHPWGYNSSVHPYIPMEYTKECVYLNRDDEGAVEQSAMSYGYDNILGWVMRPHMFEARRLLDYLEHYDVSPWQLFAYTIHPRTKQVYVIVTYNQILLWVLRNK